MNEILFSEMTALDFSLKEDLDSICEKKQQYLEVERLLKEAKNAIENKKLDKANNLLAEAGIRLKANS